MATQYRPRVQNDPNYESEEVSHAGDTYIWEGYEDGDLNGSAVNLAYYLSDDPGNQYIWDLSLIGIEVNASYCDFRDTKVINGTIHADLTCIGMGQNNEGIEFEIPTTTMAPTTTTPEPIASQQRRMLQKQSARTNEWLLAPNNLPTGLKWNIPV